jgi:hypothetical protein
MLLAGPRNTGSLGDELSLTSGRIPKSVGGDHLDNSIISESGTVITINGGTVVANAFTGSIDFSNVENTPTLVSGSSQIEITGTTGYSTFSSSLESTYLHIEGDGVYSSSAQITGNIYTPGSSFTIQDLVLGAGTTFGKITTDGSKYISVMPTYNVESARFWPNGNVTIQNGGDYVDNGFRLEVSGSARIVGDTQITGSVVITSNLTASLVSASFKGDGSQLYDIPASGVTGLELNKIVNGSISASLENNALRVNTDVYIDGTITAREVHIDYVTSSVLYQSGSTKFGDTSDDTHQFTGSLSVSNTLIVSSSQITNKNVIGLSSGNQDISTTLTGSYTSAFCNYTVSSGSNARAGQIMVVWNGSSITYTDNSTTDIGLTKNVEFTASLNTGNVVISTVLPTNGWSIKTLMNLL